MITKIKQWFTEKFDAIRILVISLLLSFFGPLLFKLSFLNGTVRIVVLLLLINGLAATTFGFLARVNRLPWQTNLIFPVVFAIVTKLFKLVTIKYSLYFALLYLILSLLVFVNDPHRSTSKKHRRSTSRK